jgi:hypothetical protein
MALKLAAFATLTAFVLLAVGVGLYDYRAGLITAGVCFAAAGIWTLTQE